MSPKRKQTAAVLALGIFAAVAGVAAVSGEPETAMPGPQVAAPVEVVVERVASGALEAPVRLTGEVLAMRRARIRAEPYDRVLEMPLRRGEALPPYGNGQSASQNRQSRQPGRR